MEILVRVAGNSIHSIMMQGRVHQIEYSSLAKSGIKEIMMHYLPSEAKLFKEAMVAAYRHIDTCQAEIRSNPEIPEECEKLLKEW